MNYHQMMRRLANILAPKEGWGKKRKVFPLFGLPWPQIEHKDAMNGKRAMARRRRQIERGMLRCKKQEVQRV